MYDDDFIKKKCGSYSDNRFGVRYDEESSKGQESCFPEQLTVICQRSCLRYILIIV